ncbi:putative cytochrome p450 protein [Neofusicoccum parvum UCRNP2]|uniref:Putative cytochrome p450 protein n=1 Tax=Botryosphaeria parva (strain UCR-NP2) TaxID=1287680 RepID=R1G492_BOTPV|nr:putative cytochrome p450 protein [Neofusicoccum parvum UCRNP2]
MSAAIDFLYTQLPHLLLRLSALALLAAVSIVTVSYIRVLSLRRHLPPGPFPLPIIGNHYRIPRIKPWVKFEEWSRQYDDPMITIWLGSRPVIVLNDAWVASEMLEKRADIYSSRPRFVAMGDLVNATETNQTTLHSVVGSHAVRNYRSFQSDEAKILTLDLLDGPADYVMSIERYSVSQVSIIGWGRRIARKNDYVAQKALEGMEAVNLVIPGFLLVESLPILANLPAWLYRLPSMLRAHSSALWTYFYALSKEAAAASPNPSFSRTLLAAQPSHALSDVEVAALTTNLVGGGVDTTSSSILSAILALCAFPSVQRAAHAELDRVVGHSRSPTAADEPALPYAQALVKEVLRWRTVTVLGGIPHAPVRADVVRGHRVPAGTQVTANVWAIHRHPREFPEPDAVRPERYLGGLRIEPGLDEEGNEVKLDIFAYSDSENMRPLPFKARFTPRSEQIAELLRSEAAEARERLRKYDGETELTMESVLAGQRAPEKPLEAL